MLNKVIIDKIDDTIVTLSEAFDGADGQASELACDAGCALMSLRGYLSGQLAPLMRSEAQGSSRSFPQSSGADANAQTCAPFPSLSTSTSAGLPRPPIL